MLTKEKFQKSCKLSYGEAYGMVKGQYPWASLIAEIKLEDCEEGRPTNYFFLVGNLIYSIIIYYPHKGSKFGFAEVVRTFDSIKEVESVLG